MKKNNWPNLFIVGASRCGTTSLHEYLKAVPDVFMSDFKNPNFFGVYDPDNINEEEDYLNLFKNAENCKIIGESSGYLRNQESPKKIFDKVPNAKIIIMLRDPIERTFSHYLSSLRSGDEKNSFNEVFQKNMYPVNKDSDFYDHFIKSSLYFEDVKRWIKVFGSNQVKVIIFEEFTKDPKNIVKQVLQFLGVDNKLPENIGKVYNEYTEPLGDIGDAIVKNKTIKRIAKSVLPGTKAREMLRTLLNKKGKKPEMKPKHRELLNEIFKEDVKNLQKLLKKELPWSINIRE